MTLFNFLISSGGNLSGGPVMLLPCHVQFHPVFMGGTCMAEHWNQVSSMESTGFCVCGARGLSFRSQVVLLLFWNVASMSLWSQKCQVKIKIFTPSRPFKWVCCYASFSIGNVKAFPFYYLPAGIFLKFSSVKKISSIILSLHCIKYQPQRRKGNRELSTWLLPLWSQQYHPWASPVCPKLFCSLPSVLAKNVFPACLRNGICLSVDSLAIQYTGTGSLSVTVVWTWSTRENLQVHGKETINTLQSWLLT